MFRNSPDTVHQLLDLPYTPPPSAHTPDYKTTNQVKGRQAHIGQISPSTQV